LLLEPQVGRKQRLKPCSGRTEKLKRKP